MGLGQVFQMLAALFVIIVLANYLLKKLNKINQVRTKAIKVIERVPVSKSSSLCIVQVGNQYMLMSFSEQGSTVVKEFTVEEKAEIQQKIHQQTKEVGDATDIKKITGTLKGKVHQFKEKYEHSFKQD